MVGIAEDVTEQRKAEDALRHARYDLELRVHERTADLAKANAALSAETAERERAMQTLRESENTYRVLVENLPQKIFLKDRNSVYVSSNHNYALDLRTPPDDLRGRTDYDFYPPELAEKYRADDRRVMESGQTEEMDEGYLQDGQERVVHTVKTPVRDEQGRVTGVLGIFWDVTERKRAEDALRESEERFRATFEQAAVGIAHVAPDGHLLRVNQRFCDIVGYSLGELLRKTFQDITHPDDLDADLAYLRRMLAGQISTYVAERRYVRKDGSIVWSDLTVALVREPSGKPKYFISVVEDIGARKRADEQIRAALEEKTVLLREVHHRVKNNLQAIISLLRIRGAQIGDPAVRQLLIQVQEQARTMSLVYEQLYQSRNLARVQMADYLRILSSNVLRAFGGRQDIDLSVDADGVVMDAQTAMPCGLIVNELVTNALKHAFPPGFVGRPAIGVELRREEARFVLKVVDNGIGLPAGLDRQNLATMGLHLVDLWATHQLGGTLQVDSGQGTAFTATFEESAKATE
jgi:PAS domain S-box-containing protein